MPIREARPSGKGHRPPDLADLPDETLVLLMASGTTEAMAVLYDRHARIAFSLALRITRDQPTAEDIVQSAFMAVWRSSSQYVPARGPASAWIHSIVRHRAIDVLRTTGYRHRADLVAGEPAGGWPRAAHDPFDGAAGDLRRALDALPDEQQRAIRLAFFAGLTHIEIAAALGVPTGTVKSRIRRGLTQMRAALEADGSACYSSPSG